MEGAPSCAAAGATKPSHDGNAAARAAVPKRTVLSARMIDPRAVLAFWLPPVLTQSFTLSVHVATVRRLLRTGPPGSGHGACHRARAVSALGSHRQSLPGGALPCVHGGDQGVATDRSQSRTR